jgi:nucleoside permease NupC
MASKLQIIIGVFLILSIAFLLSENKKEIKWRLIIIACILENIIYLSIQYIPAVHRALISLSEGVIKLLDYSNFGANFIFGELSNQSHLGFIFAITLTSTLVFLCALISIGYFFNIIQTLINVLSTLLRKNLISRNTWLIIYSMELLFLYFIWYCEYKNLYIILFASILYILRILGISKYFICLTRK